MMLLGGFGTFDLDALARQRPRWRRAALALVVALGVASAWSGLALGFLGQYAHFPNNNPPARREARPAPVRVRVQSCRQQPDQRCYHRDDLRNWDGWLT